MCSAEGKALELHQSCASLRRRKQALEGAQHLAHTCLPRMPGCRWAVPISWPVQKEELHYCIQVRVLSETKLCTCWSTRIHSENATPRLPYHTLRVSWSTAHQKPLIQTRLTVNTNQGELLGIFTLLFANIVMITSLSWQFPTHVHPALLPPGQKGSVARAVF